MNELIMELAQNGQSKFVYDVFFALGFVSVFLFVLYMGCRMKVKPLKSVLVVLIVYPIMVLWMFILCWADSGFQSFGGNNIVRVFVYVPVLAYPVAKLLKIDFKVICSMLSVGPLAVHAVSHFGCMFAGCCEGYPSSWGLWNPRFDEIRFPNQPLEALTAWAIIFFLLIRAGRKKYVPDGREYPLMLVLFGSTRFLFEFLRNNEKLLLGCSGLAFHALFMAVVGAVVLYRMKEKTAVR